MTINELTIILVSGVFLLHHPLQRLCAGARLCSVSIKIKVPIRIVSESELKMIGLRCSKSENKLTVKVKR